MVKNNLFLENKKPIEIVQEVEEKIIKKQENVKETITSFINLERAWTDINYIGSPDSNI
jgi:hypothetical protein